MLGRFSFVVLQTSRDRSVITAAFVFGVRDRVDTIGFNSHVHDLPRDQGGINPVVPGSNQIFWPGRLRRVTHSGGIGLVMLGGYLGEWSPSFALCIASCFVSVFQRDGLAKNNTDG